MGLKAACDQHCLVKTWVEGPRSHDRLQHAESRSEVGPVLACCRAHELKQSAEADCGILKRQVHGGLY